MVDEKVVEKKEDVKLEPVAIPPPEPVGIVKDANIAADRLKLENDRQEALLIRQEALYAQQRLGGNAEAGSQPEEKKEETAVEYTKRIMAGELTDEEKESRKRS